MATSIEYGLVAALIAVGAIAVVDGIAGKHLKPPMTKSTITPVDPASVTPTNDTVSAPDYTTFIDKETGCKYFQNYVGTLSIKYNAQGMPDCPGIPITAIQK